MAPADEARSRTARRGPGQEGLGGGLPRPPLPIYLHGCLAEFEAAIVRDELRLRRLRTFERRGGAARPLVALLEYRLALLHGCRQVLLLAGEPPTDAALPPDVRPAVQRASGDLALSPSGRTHEISWISAPGAVSGRTLRVPT